MCIRDRLGTYLTAVASTYVLLAYYEWVHLLLHSNYRPKTQYFKQRARSHRLHHYRNAQYWLGVTTKFSDVALGTLPESTSDVPLSSTTRTLQ